MKKTVMLDNGHGKETAGKRSPKWADGTQLFEWEFNRDIVKRIAQKCKTAGIDCRVLVPEGKDISLQERCRRANEIHQETNGNCFLISVHANAGGGTGFECYTSPGATKADTYATEICKAMQAMFPEQKMRFDYSDGDPDKESEFYILMHTKSPAILTENFFMDRETDCRLIMSQEGREAIAEAHFQAIKKIMSL
jgi:N-acetylmuramoyl-L-alanine amidase